MCTIAEAAIQGQEAGAGPGTKGSAASATAPLPAATPTVSSCLSAPDLSIAFQAACSSAAPSTASATGSGMSMASGAQEVLEHGVHALGHRVALVDDLGRAVPVHHADAGQDGGEQRVGRIAGLAAAADAHLHDVDAGDEDGEDRRHAV